MSSEESRLQAQSPNPEVSFRRSPECNWLLSKPAVEFVPPWLFSGKLSPLYSSGLAGEGGWNESEGSVAGASVVRRGVADHRARRLWQCERGVGRQVRNLSNNWLLFGRVRHEGLCSAWGRRLQSILLLESVYIRRPP